MGRKAESSYTVETTIDLGATPIRILPSQATARGRMRDLFDVVMPWLPAAKLFQDAIDGSVQLTMPFEGDVPKVNMAFQGTLGRGTLWGREFDWGRIGARVVEGEKAVIDDAELHRGEAVARGKGHGPLRVPVAVEPLGRVRRTSRSTGSTSPATAGAGPWTGTRSSAAPSTTR